MPFVLIQETFKPDVGRPDGGTARFRFDDVIEVDGNNLKLLYQPEELIFMS